MSTEESKPEGSFLRRRDVLAITGLERGTLAFWEREGFWRYAGDPEGHRWYSVRDVVQFCVARELTNEPNGLKPATAWDFIDKHPEAVDGTGVGRLTPAYAVIRKAFGAAFDPEREKVYLSDTLEEALYNAGALAAAKSSVLLVNLQLIRMSAVDAVNKYVREHGVARRTATKEGDDE